MEPYYPLMNKILISTEVHAFSLVQESYWLLDLITVYWQAREDLLGSIIIHTYIAKGSLNVAIIDMILLRSH